MDAYSDLSRGSEGSAGGNLLRRQPKAAFSLNAKTESAAQFENKSIIIIFIMSGTSQGKCFYLLFIITGILKDFNHCHDDEDFFQS